MDESTTLAHRRCRHRSVVVLWDRDMIKSSPFPGIASPEADKRAASDECGSSSFEEAVAGVASKKKV